MHTPSPSPRSLLLAVLATLLAHAAPATAQVRRSLSEPADAKAAVAKVKADLLKADPALAACLPRRHQSGDGVDWFCKVGALRVASEAEGLDAEKAYETNKPLQRRARLVSLALDTADALGFYQPQGQVLEDLPKWQVESQGEACHAAQDLFSAVAAVPEGKPVASLLTDGFPQKDAPRLAGQGLKDVTCACHQRTLALGRAGMLSEREEALARAQKQIYAVGCNLKTTGRESSLVNLKKESTGVDFTPVGGKAKPADLDREEAQKIADKRKGDLSMCTDDKARGAAAAEKMTRCACPLIQKWRFPKRETEEVLQLKVVVAEKLAPVTVEISQKGVVEKCSGAAPSP
jgi:hypothetical protein